MKISVLIIAHNEEQHIKQSIESVLKQTVTADEVVLLAHNCTDRTTEIAKQYPITVISFNGPVGIPYARMEGLDHVNGDIILCIDGDSYAAENWIKVMSSVLQKGNALVGSRVIFTGTLYACLVSMVNSFFFASKGGRAINWIWGPSMAFWSKDKKAVQEILEESVRLSEKLGLTRNPDDYWLALGMSKLGTIESTRKTWVKNYAKERNSLQAIRRNIENVRNGAIIRAYFTAKS